MSAVDRDRGRSAQEMPRPASSIDTSKAIVTFNDPAPLASIDIKDIVHISWPRVANELREAIFRIKEEGQLDSEHLADTIILITLVVRKLNEEDAEAKEALEHNPKLAFFQQLLGLLPTEIGARVREMIVGRFKAEKQAEALEATSTEIHALRLQLTTTINDKLHARLLNTDREYFSMNQESERLRIILSQGSNFRNLMHTVIQTHNNMPHFLSSTYESKLLIFRKQVDMLSRSAGAITAFFRAHLKITTAPEKLTQIPERFLPLLDTYIAEKIKELESTTARQQDRRDALKTSLYDKARKKR